MDTKRKKFKELFASRWDLPHTKHAPTAASVGVTTQALRDWRNLGKSALPDIYKVAKLADALGVSREFLAFGDGPKLKGVDGAIEELKSAGLDEADLALVRTMVDRLRREKGHVSMDEIIPVEARPVRVDRRSEIPIYTVSKRGKYAVKLPLWYDLACGPGTELARSEDYLYYRELPDWSGRHSMRIKGDSMELTLTPGDFIVVQEIVGPGGLALSEVTDPDERMSLMRFEQFVKHDDICVVSINDEEPTLKRVKIQNGNSAMKWKLMIVADNPAAWEPKTITDDTKIRFFAKLIGRAKRDNE